MLPRKGTQKDSPIWLPEKAPQKGSPERLPQKAPLKRVLRRLFRSGRPGRLHKGSSKGLFKGAL